LLGYVGDLAAQDVADVPEFNPFIRIGSDDTVRLTIHKPENGQGAVTTLCMLLAEELECDWDTLQWEFAPVARVYGFPLQGTFGSLGVLAGAQANAGRRARWAAGEADLGGARGLLYGRSLTAVPAAHRRWLEAQRRGRRGGWRIRRGLGARVGRSSRRTRYAARLCGRRIIRERRPRRDVAFAEHRSRGRLLAQCRDRSGTAGRRSGICVFGTVLRVRGWALGWPVVSPTHSRAPFDWAQDAPSGSRGALGARPRRLAGATQHNRAVALRRRETWRGVGRR